MSQYGYGHGPPGHRTSQPYGYPPPQMHTPPHTYQNGTVQAGSASYGTDVRESYDYNRAAIPGLGMGFPSTGVGWPQTWNQSLPKNQSAGSEPKNLHNLTEARNHETNDAMEEGELSEEAEDLYEPGDLKDYRDTERPADQQLHVTMNGVSGQSNQSQQQPMRERSGSYSPYLSPREVQSDGHANDVPNNASSHDTTRRANDAGDSERHFTSQTTTHDSSSAAQDQPAILVAKQRAKDAILRLWPLNIKYQNYVEEGIDRSLLDELFKELGFEVESPNEGVSVAATTSVVVQPPRESERDASDLQKMNEVKDKANEQKQIAASTESSAAPPAVPPTAKPILAQASANEPKDKTESRKDRIARLLAAKGTKSAPPAERNGPILATKASDTSDKKKAQAEKSRLIQEKMRLLMQARKAQSTEQGLADTSATQSNLSPAAPPTPPTAPAEDAALDVVPANMDNTENEPVLVDSGTSDPSSALPIPGLFLSPDSSSSPAAKSRKRPVAADLNESSVPEPQKRPFGQAREARPFLIDVSDDEDDAEMEIDSPEQRPSVVYRPTTPGSRTTSFRGHPPLSDSVSRRAPHSPNNSATPTTGINGKIDLESMNKKIEDMKRMIAEAEARKRAKHSSNESPSLSQSQVQSKEGSLEAGSEAQSAAVTPSNDNTNLGTQRQLMMTPSNEASLRIQKSRSQLQPRPSPRARIASERLPVVAARRREQLEKLKQLQAEVKRIEKEIQDGLDLEKQLQEQALETETNEENTQEQCRSISPTSENDAQQIDQQIKALNNQQGQQDDDSNEPRRDSQDASNEHPVTEMTAEGPLQTLDDPSSSDEADQDEPMDESSSTGEAEAEAEAETETGHVSSNDVGQSEQPPPASTVSHQSDVMQGYMEDVSSQGAASSVDAEDDEDVEMEEEDADSSSEQDTDESSDDYEPTEFGVDLPGTQATDAKTSIPPTQSADSDGPVTETSDTDLQGVSVTSPVKYPISTANADSESDTGREPTRTKKSKAGEETHVGPVPYKTPLQYFRSYRFHPKYKDSVSGGLRSLTYSNKIDVEKEVCPDELLEGECRRPDCQFQHFKSMQAADDQILLQLGGYSNYEGEQKQQYVAGLRQLLTDFRNRKIKDFDTIGQGIIEYRAKFHGDNTKILPLGGVSI